MRTLQKAIQLLSSDASITLLIFVMHYYQVFHSWYQ